jgi:hypothetical protein
MEGTIQGEKKGLRSINEPYFRNQERRQTKEIGLIEG